MRFMVTFVFRVKDTPNLWSLLGVRIKGVPRHLCPFLGQLATLGHELVINLLVDKRSTSGDTALSGVHHNAVMRKLHSLVH